MIIRLMPVTAALGLLGTAAARASDRWETLQAIHWVENPNNETRVGAHGEMGPYQFRVATWRMHTSRPFSLAMQRKHADEVAVKHYEWIKAGLERAGIHAGPFNIALAWNCGLDAVVTGRVPAVSYGYAEQVQNLVEKLKQQKRLAAASDPAPEGSFTVSWTRFDILSNETWFNVPTGGPRYEISAYQGAMYCPQGS